MLIAIIQIGIGNLIANNFVAWMLYSTLLAHLWLCTFLLLMTVLKNESLLGKAGHVILQRSVIVTLTLTLIFTSPQWPAVVQMWCPCYTTWLLQIILHFNTSFFNPGWFVLTSNLNITPQLGHGSVSVILFMDTITSLLWIILSSVQLVPKIASVPW